MSTLSALQEELRRKEAEETRVRAEYESFTTRIQEIFSQERPLEIELRQQRSIIQDTNASQAQKDAALDRALGLEQELRVLENQTLRLRDQQSAFQRNRLEPIQREIYGPGGLQEQVRQAETQQSAQAAQGPKTNSAGETATEAQQANAAGANNQTPAGPSEKANATGEVSAAPANTVPSNADSATTSVAEGTTAPPRLPDGSPSTTGGFRIDISGTGPQGTALQVTTPNIATPEANNNLVSYIYKATRVVSKFQQGKFTQDIEGVQIFFELPRIKNNPDLNRSLTPTPTTAPPPVTTNVARSQSQGTVAQTAKTPGIYNSGVSYANQSQDGSLESEIGASRFLPTGAFESEGSPDLEADQSYTVAPLEINPPSTENNTDISPARPQQDLQSNTTNTALQQGAREY
jgi:hypothetical protein